MQNLVFIHGANCTPSIWNYMAPKIKGKKTFIAYDTAIPFEKNLIRIKEEWDVSKDAIIIAHSMGGLYASRLYQSYPETIKACVTISTPFNGSVAAGQLSLYYPEYQMLKDIYVNSTPVTESRKALETINIPWLQIVSTTGHVPLINKPNDGVVGIDSQQHHKHMDSISLPYNHFEILLNEDTVLVVNEFLKKIA